MLSSSPLNNMTCDMSEDTDWTDLSAEMPLDSSLTAYASTATTLASELIPSGQVVRDVKCNDFVIGKAYTSEESKPYNSEDSKPGALTYMEEDLGSWHYSYYTQLQEYNVLPRKVPQDVEFIKVPNLTIEFEALKHQILTSSFSSMTYVGCQDCHRSETSIDQIKGHGKHCNYKHVLKENSDIYTKLFFRIDIPFVSTTEDGSKMTLVVKVFSELANHILGLTEISTSGELSIINWWNIVRGSSSNSNNYFEWLERRLKASTYTLWFSCTGGPLYHDKYVSEWLQNRSPIALRFKRHFKAVQADDMTISYPDL